MITLDELESIRAGAFADDLAIRDEMRTWSREAATAFFEGGGEPAPPPPPPPPPVTRYEVAVSYVNVRDKPSIGGNVVDKKKQGETVVADGRTYDKWIRLKDLDCWVLVDGSSLGLTSELLRRISGPEPPLLRSAVALTAGSTMTTSSSGADAETTRAAVEEEAKSAGAPPPPIAPPVSTVALAAPVSWEVVHSYVRVRTQPSATSAEVRLVRKGTVVSADACHGEWIRLEADASAALPTGGGLGGGGAGAGGGGWMLTDGKAMTPPLGTLLKPHVVGVAAGTQWQVTRSGGVRGYASPGGGARGEAPRRLTGAEEGCLLEVLAECGLWAQVKTSGGPAWVEMDCFFAG